MSYRLFEVPRCNRQDRETRWSLFHREVSIQESRASKRKHNINNDRECNCLLNVTDVDTVKIATATLSLICSNDEHKGENAFKTLPCEIVI